MNYYSKHNDKVDLARKQLGKACDLVDEAHNTLIDIENWGGGSLGKST